MTNHYTKLQRAYELLLDLHQHQFPNCSVRSSRSLNRIRVVVDWHAPLTADRLRNLIDLDTEYDGWTLWVSETESDSFDRGIYFETKS